MDEIKKGVTPETKDVTAVTSLPKKVQSVHATLDDDMISAAAKVATRLIILATNGGMDDLKDDIQAYCTASLRAAIAKSIDPEIVFKDKDNKVHKPLIPVFWHYLVKGLDGNKGRVLISAKPAEAVTYEDLGYPSSTRELVMQLNAAGFKSMPLPMVREDERYSDTLYYFREEIDGEDCVLGRIQDIDPNDIVRRCLIKAVEEDEATLRSLLGVADYSYGGSMTIVGSYVSAIVRSARI